MRLTATVLPENATDKRVTWSSSNTSVATVDSDGLLTGVAPGKADITVACVADPSVKDTETITVVSAVVKPTSVTVTGLPTSLDLHTASSKVFDLSASVAPDDATDKTVSWSVDGPATLDGSTLTVTGTGTVTVTATCNGDNTVTGTATLTVTDSTPANIPATSMTVSGLPDTVDIYKKKTYYVTVTVLPANATSKEWVFKADDMSMVQPVEGGVRFKKAGIVKLTFFMSRTPSVTWSKTITVTDSSPILPTGLTINGLPSTADMASTKTIQLSAVVTPSNASDPSVTWSVSGPATITQDGLLTLTGTGDVTVTATSNAVKNVTATAKATVSDSSNGQSGWKEIHPTLSQPVHIVPGTMIRVTGESNDPNQIFIEYGTLQLSQAIAVPSGTFDVTVKVDKIIDSENCTGVEEINPITDLHVYIGGGSVIKGSRFERELTFTSSQKQNDGYHSIPLSFNDSWQTVRLHLSQPIDLTQNTLIAACDQPFDEIEVSKDATIHTTPTENYDWSARTNEYVDTYYSPLHGNIDESDIEYIGISKNIRSSVTFENIRLFLLTGGGQQLTNLLTQSDIDDLNVDSFINMIRLPSTAKIKITGNVGGNNPQLNLNNAHGYFDDQYSLKPDPDANGDFITILDLSKLPSDRGNLTGVTPLTDGYSGHWHHLFATWA